MHGTFTRQSAACYSSSKNVLLVGELPGDIALTRRTLARVGSNIHLEVIQDRNTILERLGAAGTQSFAACALVLVDLSMTKIDGYELVKTIRDSAFAGDMPIVVISTSQDEAEVLRQYQLGASSFIFKSHDFTVYAQTLYEACAYWLNQTVAEKPFRSLG